MYKSLVSISYDIHMKCIRTIKYNQIHNFFKKSVAHFQNTKNASMYIYSFNCYSFASSLKTLFFLGRQTIFLEGIEVTHQPPVMEFYLSIYLICQLRCSILIHLWISLTFFQNCLTRYISS